MLIGYNQIFPDHLDYITAEETMRDAAVKLGSLAGMCINPILGTEAKTLPPNSFSYGQFVLRPL